jgi:hypothetical protein
MAQLLKHYFINRETNTFALNTKFGLMVPDIKGLTIVHQLTDENDIPYCLSTCPEYFEYTETVSGERLQELQSDANITVLSSSEVSVDGETLYEVNYRRAYVLEEVEGLWILTQEEWDNEVSSYDARQTVKRYDIIKSITEELLSATDWVVVKATEQGTTLSTEFKTWRQSLRDLPDGEVFPSEIPAPPLELQNNHEVPKIYSRWSEVVAIPMINDPLSVAV